MLNITFPFSTINCNAGWGFGICIICALLTMFVGSSLEEKEVERLESIPWIPTVMSCEAKSETWTCTWKPWLTGIPREIRFHNKNKFSGNLGLTRLLSSSYLKPQLLKSCLKCLNMISRLISVSFDIYYGTLYWQGPYGTLRESSLFSLYMFCHPS